MLAASLTACTATRSFDAVGGTGSNDVWIVGFSAPAESSYSTPLASHWDGAAWSAQPAVPGGGLNGVWSASANDVWFAGGSTRRWDGTAWHTLDMHSTDDDTQAVWGDGAGGVWAVSLAGDAYRFDSSGTLTMSMGVTGQALLGVWGAASNDVWAVGRRGTVSHWQGTSWTPSTIPVTTWSLNAVAGNASNDVWSVGDDGTIVHWDGVSWTSVASGTAADLKGIWADGSGGMWAVGGRTTNGDYGVVLRFDGTSWSQSYRADHELLGIWGSSASDVWAVGANLAVVHWNGTRWTSQHVPT